MKVCVIGAIGQLGADIVLAKPPGVDLIELTRAEIDITRPEQVRSVLAGLRPDSIINTAAFHKTDACEDDPDLSFAVNAVAVRDIAEVARDIRSIVIHVSTDYVFDGRKEYGRPYLETDHPNPINTYGLSKYAGELYLMNTWERSYVVRVASLFGGRGASGKGGNFVTTIRRKFADTQDTLRVVCDIGISPTYTVDAAKAIWSLLIEERGFGIYHATNKGHCTWYEFAREIVSLSGARREVVPVPHTEYPTRAIRPLWSALASGREIETRSWKDALGDYITELGVKGMG